MTEPQPPARREGPLRRKIGPLPTWGWITIVGGAILAWAWFSERKAATSQASAGPDQVPPFINQVYTSPFPPSAPVPDTEDNDEDERPHPRAHRKRIPPGEGKGGETGPPTRQPRHHKGRGRHHRPVTSDSGKG